MEIQLVRTCPICGEHTLDSLTEHLQSHSKEALIDILLAQRAQIRTLPPSTSSNHHVHTISEEEQESIVAGGGQILSEFQEEEGVGETNPNPKNKSDFSAVRSSTASQTRKGLHGQPSSGLHSEFESEATTTSTTVNKPGKPSSAPPVVKTEIDSGPFRKQLLFESPRGKPTFVLVDHSVPSKPGPSKRRVSNEITQLENAAVPVTSSSGSGEIPPSTSIIQYIIDESGQITDAPQEEPDSWILADGRTIPVYSSLTQVPAVSETTPSCTMAVNMLSKAVEKETLPVTLTERSSQPNQMHLDLMTDEEIPPRGEISEYEESNASSILSEDSNLRPNASGMFLDRRSPATVMHEQNLLLNRKKKSPKAQQYTCHDCPQVQVFRGFFELAEHKLEVHQNKSANSSTAASIAVKSTVAESILPVVEHILPEKIRRQSQNDDSNVVHLEPVEEKEVLLSGSSSAQKASASKKEYFCVYCNFTATRKTAMAEHMETSHAGQPRTPNMFECNYCGKIFRARTNLRKHLLIHKERKYNCPTCSKGFTSNFKVTEHMRVHTKTYPYKCTVCEKTYRTLSLRNHHMKMVHVPEGERPAKRKLEFYCSTCHRILHSKRSYLNHIQLHKEKPMKCTFCSELFTRRSVLVRHIRMVHDPQFESKESKDCPVCHKKLHPNSMIKHMRIHSNEKPYSCNVCGKFFRTHANLTSHSWSHTNVEKPHKCRQCSKSYLFRKNLENHMMVHKKRTMHFTCNECGVKFSHKVNMKRHLEEHFKEKSHVCKICHKAFQRHYYLIEHERIHSGVKPFQCTICGKASTTKSNHRAHMKIHDARETGNQEG